MTWLKGIGCSVFVLALLAGVLMLGSRSYQLLRIPSSSMEPAIQAGDTLLVRTSGRTSPHRGELFVFRTSEGLTVKRVVAVGGDRVRIHEKALFIDGKEQHEDYVIHIDARMVPSRDEYPSPSRQSGQVGPDVVVPAASSFALGDNRDNSFDSRNRGFYRDSEIVGPPVLIVYSHEIDPGNFMKPGALRWGRLFKGL